MSEEEVERARLGAQAAQSFHTLACELLDQELGKYGTKAAVYNVIGEYQSNYSRGVRGGSVSLETVSRWIAAWNTARPEHVALVLSCDGHTATVLQETEDTADEPTTPAFEAKETT